MEMKHFSHEHPLKLIDKAPRDDEEILCDGCRESVILGSAAAYGCNECKYVLHKKCAELPKEINHPMHSEHSLTLLSHPPYRSLECSCEVVHIQIKHWKWFTYHCSVCEFDVHVSCALLVDEDVIIHEGHHHPLTFVPRSASFLCDACFTEDRDSSYRCTSTTCHFWIHKTCAKSPSTITRSDDDHPLILTYSLPNTFRNFIHVCNICKKKVLPSYWVYYCGLCRYFAHLKCATKEKKPLMTLRNSEEYLDSDLMNFPLPDKSIDLISQFVKSTSLEAVNDVARELTHLSHDHPLILVDVESDDAEMMINKEVQCDGCVQPISVPFYTCRECNFFLHKCCAELPREILQHPYHPQHTLSLYSQKYFFRYQKCDLCRIFFNGFFYMCPTCNFRVDVQCACLPKAIKHDAHNHPLELEAQSSSYKCSGCRYSFTGSKYGCGTCGEFDFGISCCVSLPSTFKHEWDRHQLTLSYPPFSYHPDEFICEICEEDIHPNYSLYHCRQCDQSFHTNCIKPFDGFTKVKFGGTLEVENHPHPLVFVPKSKKNKKSPNSICSQCGKSRDGWPVLECTPCNFQLCPNCCYHIVKSLP